MNEIKPALLTIKQVAQRLNWSVSTIRRIRERDDAFPKAVQTPVQNKTLFKASDIDEYIDRLNYE